MINRIFSLSRRPASGIFFPRFAPPSMTMSSSPAGSAASGAKADAINAALDEDLDEAEELSPHLRGEAPKIREREVDALGRGYGTGRRKTSVARVWVSEGSGVVTVNERSVIDYFDQSQREHSLKVFMHSKTSGFFDVWATVKGGGKMGTCVTNLRSIVLHN